MLSEVRPVYDFQPNCFNDFYFVRLRPTPILESLLRSKQPAKLRLKKLGTTWSVLPQQEQDPAPTKQAQTAEEASTSSADSSGGSAPVALETNTEVSKNLCFISTLKLRSSVQLQSPKAKI